MPNKIPKNGIVNADQEITVTLTAKPEGYAYGSGTLLDLMAYAAEEATSADLETWDAEHEAVKTVWNEQGAELVRDSLNELDPAAVCAIANDPDITPDMFKASEYLPGDFLELEHPRTFARIVDGIRPHDVVCGEGPAWLLPAAVKALEEAEGYVQEEAEKEWLNGDYHGNYAGVLNLIPRAMFGKYTDAVMSWDPKTDSVTITATAQEWADYLGEDWLLDDNLLQLPRDGASCDYEANLADSVSEAIQYAADSRARVHKAKAEADHAERLKRQADRAASEARALEAKKAAALERAKSKK